MILPRSIAKRIPYRQTSKGLINNIMCKAIDDKSKEYNNVLSPTSQYPGISTSFIIPFIVAFVERYNSGGE